MHTFSTFVSNYSCCTCHFTRTLFLTEDCCYPRLWWMILEAQELIQECWVVGSILLPLQGDLEVWSSDGISLLHSVSLQYSKPGKTCGSRLILVNQVALGNVLVRAVVYVRHTRIHKYIHCTYIHVHLYSASSIIQTPLCQFHHKSVQIREFVQISTLYTKLGTTTLIEHTLYSYRTVNGAVQIIQIRMHCIIILVQSTYMNLLYWYRSQSSYMHSYHASVKRILRCVKCVTFPLLLVIWESYN